jgi:hypothetical protein
LALGHCIYTFAAADTPTRNEGGVFQGFQLYSTVAAEQADELLGGV